MTIIDAHLHLNGSVSEKYLEDTAKLNSCTPYYQSYQSETDPWKKFDWVHKIIQTTEDITRATIDVVVNSTADILEIRTTPKPMGNQSVEDYIQAFITGLLEANRLFPDKKVRGLLSIDRTRHSLESAKKIIDTAVVEKQKSGMIVGIDLSGNYLAKRSLTGNSLYEMVKYGLSKDIGLALHVGEVNSEDERQDFDFILKAIDEYNGKIYGKVRLGHAIFRTASQDEIIQKRKIPVEICPSCHRLLDWWKPDTEHSILTLYNKRKRVLPGTDDSLIFHCNAKTEQETLDQMLNKSDKNNNLSIDEENKIVAEKRKRYMFF